MLDKILDIGGALLGYQSQKKQMAQAQGQFDSQMDESVQRRVADAKKAGVHPLFALGGSVGASPTSRSPTGSALKDGLSRVADKLAQSKLDRAAIRSATASATRDEAEASYIDAQKALLGQEFSSRGRDGAAVDTNAMPGDQDVVFGPAELVKPQVSYSKRTGVESGTHPEKLELITEGGDKITIPSPNLGLDEVAQVEYVWDKINLMRKNSTKDYGRTLDKYDSRVQAMLKREAKNLKAGSGLYTLPKRLWKFIQQHRGK